MIEPIDYNEESTSEPVIKKKPNYVADVFILLGVELICVFVFSLFSMLLSTQIFDVTFFELAEIVRNPSEIQRDVNLLKFSQAFSMLGMFIGAVVFLLTTKKNILTFLNIQFKVNPIFILLSLVLVFVVMPFNAYLVGVNDDIASGMGYSNDKLMGVYHALGSFNDFKGMIFTILVMAILPAVTEEVLFRGIVQKLFIKITKNPHVGIAIASILFAIIHFNPNQLVGLLILGFLLGYLMHYTKNIWYPILFHMTNNLLAVIALHYERKGSEIELLSNDFHPNVLLALVSLMLTLGAFYFINLKTKNI